MVSAQKLFEIGFYVNVIRNYLENSDVCFDLATRTVLKAALNITFY